MIPWDQSFSTGIDIVDEQHKYLFSLGRKLELLLQVPDGVNKKDDAIKLLGDFRNYVTYHFYTEEKLMESINYPYIKKHKDTHRRYLKQITNIDINNIYDNNYNELRTLLNNIYSWIFDHISEETMNCQQYINTIS